MQVCPTIVSADAGDFFVLDCEPCKLIPSIWDSARQEQHMGCSFGTISNSVLDTSCHHVVTSRFATHAEPSEVPPDYNSIPERDSGLAESTSDKHGTDIQQDSPEAEAASSLKSITSTSEASSEGISPSGQEQPLNGWWVMMLVSIQLHVKNSSQGPLCVQHALCQLSYCKEGFHRATQVFIRITKPAEAPCGSLCPVAKASRAIRDFWWQYSKWSVCHWLALFDPMSA